METGPVAIAPFRFWAFLGALAPTLAMAFALYLQYGRELEPCPMCIFQRVAMIGLIIVWLAALAHGPARWGRWVYAALGGLVAGIGAAIAARHVWLQNLPEDQVPACGPSLDYLMEVSPWQEVVATVLRGDGNCAIIDASFLGLSIPGWTLVAFVGLGLASLLVPLLSTAKES